MTLRAVGAKAPLVFILVASPAGRRKAHPRAAQIFVQQQGTLRRGDVLCHMACTATHPYMLAIEQVSGLGMIEARCRRGPVDHVEVHAVVIGVAFYAGRPYWAGARKRGMQPLVLLDLRSDLAMAFQALE